MAVPLLVAAGVVAAAAPARAAHGELAGGSAPVRVAVVVDLGPHAGAREFIVRCLKVPRGTNGAVVLADVTSFFHVPAPTYAASGLLCSIAGHPMSGCGVATSSGYAYWSYWHGVDGHWSYANVGPVDWTVGDADVEGWRFEAQGSASPTDAPPGVAATYGGACAFAESNPAPLPSGSASSSSVPVDVAVGAFVLVLGGAGVVQWRRRLRT